MTVEPNEAHMDLLADHECQHGFLPDDENPTCNCWQRFDLQRRLDALRAGRAPLPMTEGEAIVHAVRLRSGGMTYGMVALVMAVYHGRFWAEATWRRRCRAHGAVPIYRGYAVTKTQAEKATWPA